MVRRRAFFGGQRAEPIPPRSGLALPSGPQEAPAIAAPRANLPRGIGAESIPRTLSGESALRQVLTGQDNANLMRIAKARGISVGREQMLKPGIADKMLVDKIIADFSPEELDEVGARYLESNRFRHEFGEIGPEAWKTMGMQAYFPEVKIPEATLKRAQAAIQKPMIPAPGEDLEPILRKSLRSVKAKEGNGRRLRERQWSYQTARSQATD